MLKALLYHPDIQKHWRATCTSARSFCCQNLSEREWFSTNCSALDSLELQGLSVSVRWSRWGSMGQAEEAAPSSDSQTTRQSATVLIFLLWQQSHLLAQGFMMFCWLPRWSPPTPCLPTSYFQKCITAWAFSVPPLSDPHGLPKPDFSFSFMDHIILQWRLSSVLWWKERILVSLILIPQQQGTFFLSVSLINKVADERVTHYYEPFSWAGTLLR